MEVTVNSKVCIGCGLCVHLLPNVFEMTKDGKARVINQTADIGNIGCQCPVQAIAV